MLDEEFMLEALIEAEKAAADCEVPVGAVLVREGKILVRSCNQSIKNHDASAHAEILALRAAGARLKNYRLNECELYVTLEPCAMCLGAVVQARVKRLIYGAADPKAGAVESIMSFPFEKTNHELEIKGGILAEKCGKILKDFFKSRR